MVAFTPTRQFLSDDRESAGCKRKTTKPSPVGRAEGVHVPGCGNLRQGGHQPGDLHRLEEEVWSADTELG